MRPTTLCFPMNEQGCLLLGRKKRGFGVAKWNGFGGKIEANETFTQCAIRELWEETGLKAKEEDLSLVGFLDFQFCNQPDLNHVGCIYFLRAYTGTPKETEEMEPHWFGQDVIPFDQMWKGDRTWLPLLLQHHFIKGTVVFAANNDTVLHMEIEKTTSEVLQKLV